MKKFVGTYPGKHHLTLDDLAFFDNKINEVVAALTGPTPLVILTGCTLTQGAATWQVSDGYIALGQEVFKIDAADTGLPNATDPNSAGALYFNIVETVISPSPVVYLNLISRNVHFDRKMVLNTTASLIEYRFVPTYGQLLAGQWHTVGNTGEPVFATNFQAANSTSVRFRKSKDGRVTFSGTVTYNSTPPSSPAEITMFTLPAGYIPVQQEIFAAHIYGDLLGGYIRIYPVSGEVKWEWDSGFTAGQYWPLSHISFFTD